MPPSSRRSSQSEQGQEEKTPPRSGDALDHLARFQGHFGRFLRDMAGVLLLAFAMLVLVGILGWSEGELLAGLVGFIKKWFGWGSIFIVLTAGAGGVIVLRAGRQAIPLQWGKVVSLELVALMTLAVLSVIGGDSLYQADGGWWGGRIGWGLSTLVSSFLGTIPAGILIFLVWGLAIMSAFGLWHRLETWLLRQAGEAHLLDVRPDTGIEADSPPPDEPTTTTRASRSKKQEKLPPEFRKSFKVPEKQDILPKKPVERSESLPPLNLLVSEQNVQPDERNINQTAGLIEKTLAEFGIPARVVGFRIGPTVTQFAVEPGFLKSGENGDENKHKVRVAQIASLQRDLALALSAQRLRIEAPVPGRSYVGVEVPNSRSVTVRLRPILESDAFYRVDAPLAVALGRDVSGQPVVADLSRMPHLLIAGTTGSGKSVCIAALTTCLVMNNTPDELRLIMIDAKKVELIRFNGLPHMYGKVETDLQRILGVLRWAVVEMEHRYKLLEAAKARDIAAYNRRLQQRKDSTPLPRIVIMIDELADLMMSASDQTEASLVRLAQMARATGIHLVVATQRPSTDVVTGLIKANFPARLSFAVASGVDSRVILDLPGAESLLGHGDMLWLNPEIGNPVRSQGVMVTDQEVERVISFWQKAHTSAEEERPPWETLLNQPEEGDDEILIEKAISILKQEQRASASMLQRRLRIGYPRAARLLDQLEEMGVVGPSPGGGRDREVLVEPGEDGDEEDDD